MRAMTCACGQSTYFDGGISPQPCQGCGECGTNYEKQPRTDHDWKPRYDPDTGEPTRRVCKRCYTRERTTA